MSLLEEDERYAFARSAKRFVHFSWTRVSTFLRKIARPSLKAPAFELQVILPRSSFAGRHRNFELEIEDEGKHAM
jgi:hypothetical protein